MLHQPAQHGQVHRLGDEVEGAGLERVHRGFDVAEGGDHGHRDVRVALGDVFDQLLAGSVRQAHVGKAQVVGALGELGLGRSHVGGGIHPQAHSAQGEDQKLPDVALVIYYQGAAGGCHAVRRGWGPLHIS